jgi:hypothetical protein
MPADGDAANAGQAQSSAIQLKAVSILLEAERVEALAVFEAWIAGDLTFAETAEEGGKRLVQVADNHLENVAVDAGSERVVALVDLDAAQLLHFANGSAFRLVDRLALAQAIVVEAPTCLQSGMETLTLSGGWKQAITKSFEHQWILSTKKKTFQVDSLASPWLKPKIASPPALKCGGLRRAKAQSGQRPGSVGSVR